MAKKMPWRILDALKEARKAATLENASFDDRYDALIKDEVRLHHKTWIIGPIDRAIAWAEGKPRASQ